MSAESGVPTFRDKQTGLWERFDAAALATLTAFRRDPSLVWGWYEWRRQNVLVAQPNAAHQAIVALSHHFLQFTLVTQNVDDLHERSGSRDVLHLHGELARPYCERCRGPYSFPTLAPGIPLQGHRIEPPRCAICGGSIRPGVVWFGESLPEQAWQAALKAARECEVFLSVGTSSLVQPAASLTNVAAHAGAVTVQINPNPTDLDSSVTLAIREFAGEALPRLVLETWPET